MKDTTSPREESDDPAGVATGRPAGSADPAAQAAATPDQADGNGTVRAEPGGGRRPSPGAQPGGDTGAANGDAPTAQIRLPKPGNGAPATVNSMPAGSNVGAGPEPAPAGPTPAGPTPTGPASTGPAPTGPTPAPTTPAPAPGPTREAASAAASSENSTNGTTGTPADSSAPAVAAAPDRSQPATPTPAAASHPAAAPGASVRPGLAQPNAAQPNVPQANVPQPNVPQANVAQANVPQVNVPQANVAQANVPPANVPQPNGAAAPAPRASAEPEPVPAGATVSSAAPTTGPIPAPGPGAASPPPWHRVPGRAPQPADRAAAGQQASAEAGGLLDGPTAYLMPDPDPTADTTETQQVKSWAPVRSGRTRPPRRAALQLKRLDPWSMLKLGLVLAVVIFFIWLVAVGVLYGVLDGMGVWDRLNGTYADLVSGEAPTGSPLISAGRVFGLAAVIGAINSLLFAVAMTIGAFVYNVSADLVGGIEVTLSERD